MNNFIGKDGFNWWVGVVENRMDPLAMGRCQVRIFGYHTEDKSLIPTDDLPWAPCVASPNASHSFSTPKEGDYVIGFFADGMSSQSPTIIGIYPGIKQSGGSSSGFQDPRTQAEIDAAPKPPTGQVQESVGQPTTAPLARGVYEGTALEKAYKERAHNCDICAGLNKDIASAKSEIMTYVGELRTAIEEFFDGIKSDPAAEEIKQEIAAMKAKAKALQKEVQPLIDEVTALQEYIQQMQALIQEILSAPAELQALLQACLSEATSALSSAQSQLAAIPADVLATKEKALQDITNSITNATANTA